MSKFNRFIWVAIAALFIFVSSAPAQSKKILFIAGPKDHGAPNMHEYPKDLATLQYSLEHSNIQGLQIRMYTTQAPPTLDDMKDAAAIVIESSGDQVARETHSLFPQMATTDGKSYPPEVAARLDGIDQLMKKGMGLVVLHYSTIIGHPVARTYFLDWLGGFFEQNYSKVTMTEWKVDLENPKHPVLNGVQPWTGFREEFFTKLRLPEDPRRTALLTATTVERTPNPRLPAIGDAAEVVAFATQRQGGGRGFVMTGVHSHANLANENNRRTVLNGIIWAANIAVPAGGVVSKLPEDFQ